MRLIKLTDADGYTRRGETGETLWLPVGTTPPTLDGAELCKVGVYHAYTSPEQAALMDPIHAKLLPAGRAWWAEGIPIVDDGTKCGCHSLTLVGPAELPKLSIAVRVRAAIYCAQAVVPKGAIPQWDAWADVWLSGADRSEHAAADAAAYAAADATEAAADAADAAYAAADAAGAARARAAWAAADAAADAVDIAAIVQRALADEGGDDD